MEKQYSNDPILGRRQVAKGIAGLVLGIALLGVGAVKRLYLFFRGPVATDEQQAALLDEQMQKNEETARIERLRIQRLRDATIEVAKLSELTPATGIYFYDYLMRPGLAFLDKDGLPHLISAKCTHLGCTLGNTVDSRGDLLCPCHLSLFNAATGAVERGPATVPLPLLGWVLKDPAGNIVAHKPPLGRVTGSWDKTKLDSYTVCIARQYKGGEAL